MNNVFDQDPPFVAGYLENGYDPWHGQYQGANLVCGAKEAFLKHLGEHTACPPVCGRLACYASPARTFGGPPKRSFPQVRLIRAYPPRS